MSRSETALTALACHPASRSTTICGVRAGCSRIGSTTFEFVYRVEADVHRLKLGEPGPRQRRDRLWESTCFEAFVATGSGGYLEFNFSPGGDWAAYRFVAYRRPDPEAVCIGAPDVHTERSSDLLSVMALIDAPELLRHGDPATLRVGLTAVVEELDETRTYWALRHTQPRPDFHDPAGFAWRLDPEPAAGIEMEIR